MKKFFALFTVVALLAVTGSAFAANPTITVNPSSVTVQAGGTAVTATVSAEPANGGELSAVTVQEPSWVSIEDNTVTFAPTTAVTAGTYSAILKVTESYIPASGDNAGHEVENATGTATVTVTVTQADIPSDDTGEKEAATKKTVKIIKQIVAKVIAVERAIFRSFGDMNRVTIDTTNLIQQIIIGLSALPGITVPAGTTVNDSNDIETASTSNYTAGDNIGNLQRAAAKLKQMVGNDSKRAVGVGSPFKAKKSGIQLLKLLEEINQALRGFKIGLHLGKSGGASSQGILAADENGNNEAVFYDDYGNPITEYPDEGGVTAAVYVEIGSTYEPILTADVSSADEASFDTATGTTTTTVEVETEEEVLATDDGTFSAAVDDSVITAIGISGLEMLPSNVGSTAKPATTTTEETYMTANNLTLVYALPGLSNIPDGTYVVQIIFTADAPASSKKPVLYTNGIKEGGSVNVRLFVMDSTGTTATEITDDNAASLIKRAQPAYLVFKVESENVVSVSDADTINAAEASLANASLVVSPADTPVNNPTGPGSNDGGCSAGFSALALAVLGGFIAARKK